jgi:hypothetical protein
MEKKKAGVTRPPSSSTPARILAEATDGWTAADEAELDAVLHALVRGAFEHREVCDVCRAGFPPCPYVGEAITAVLDWRSFRRLLSKAERLRLEQDELHIVSGVRDTA